MYNEDFGGKGFEGPSEFGKPSIGYEREGFEEREFKENKFKKFLKPKFILPIIAVIVIIIVLMLLLKPSYLVSYNIVDSQGNKVSNATITIRDSAGSTVASLSSGQEKSLPQGTYSVVVSAPGYKTKSASLDLSANSTGTNFALSKDIKLKSLVTGFPEKLFIGQTVTTDKGITFTIQNTGNNDAEDLELEFGNAFKDFQFETNPAVFNLTKGSTEQIAIALSVPDTLKVKAEGEAKKGTISIKGTDEQKEVEFTLFPKIEVKISDPSNKRIEKTLKAGTGQKEIVKAIKIKNDSKFSVDSIKFSIELNEGMPEGAEKWFSLSKEETGVLGAGKESTVTLLAEIPGDAGVQNVEGKILLTNDYYSDAIELFITVELPETKMEASVSKTTFDIALTTTGDYEKETTKVTVTNKGKTRLVSPSIKLTQAATDAGCDQYVKIIKESLKSLDAGENDDSLIEVSAPVGATIETKACNITISSESEFGDKQSEEETLYIKVLE